MSLKTPVQGVLVDGKYRLGDRIGGGGMGDVFRAENVMAGRAVAIKFLHPELAENPEISQRFFQEAQAVNRIRHPNVIDVIDAGISEHGPYLVMEHLDGESVGSALGRLGRFGMEGAIATCIPVLEALDAAHRVGVIHRDLKPENVFIALDAGKGVAVVRLLDFGIAKVLTEATGVSPRTRTGIVFGTPDYLSPEQATGEGPLDGRSDLFAIGVLLFEMLTGQRPFRAATAVATAFRVVHADAPTLASVGVCVDPRVEAIVQRLLQKDASRRFESAGDVVRELERVVPDPGQRLLALGKIISITRRLAQIRRASPTPERPSEPRIEAPVRDPSPRGRAVEAPPPSSVAAPFAPTRLHPSTPPRARLPDLAPAAALRVAEPVQGAPSGSKAAIRPLPARFAGRFQVRGPVLRSVDRGIQEVHGKSARDEIVASMPARFATDFRNDSINALVSYELEALDAYMELATAMTVRDLARWRELGRLAVSGELGSFVRPALKRSPDVGAAVRRGATVWARFFSFGGWRVNSMADDRVALTIGEFDPASLPLRLWLVGVIEATARRAVRPDVSVTILLGEMGFTPELACEIRG